MTEAHRQKFLNWVTSMSLCLGYLAIGPLVGFFINSEIVFRLTDPDMHQYKTGAIIWVLLNVITIFVAISLIMIFWHASDVIQQDKPRRFILNAFASYRLIFGAALVTICGALIIESGVLASLHCPPSDPENNVYVFCTPDPSRGAVPLVYLPLLLMSLIAVGKCVFAAWSRIRMKRAR